MNRGVLFVLASLLLTGLKATARADEEHAKAPATAPAPNGQVIILKLDDVYQYGKRPIPPRWQRVADYIEESKLKANFGIIGDSLEQDNAPYFEWIKAHQKKGYIEFWCHGYHFRKPEEPAEFENGSVAEQQAALQKCQDLARQKLGFTFPAFGPHFSNTNEATEHALQNIPEFRIWLYGPHDSKFYKKLSIERVINGLEYPTFAPDFQKFKSEYEKHAVNRKVVPLQGHANRWDDARWAEFVKIVEYLKGRGCTFMTASEYYDFVTPASDAAK